LYNATNWNAEGVDSSGSVVITLSYSQTVKLQPGVEYYGTLHSTEYAFQLFKLSPQNGFLTKISFSSCLGDPMISVINGSSTDLLLDSTKVIPTSFQRINGLDVAYVQGLDEQNQYLVMVDSA